LKDADWIIITPGTATVYVDLSRDQIVANCHKLPAAAFEKRMLTTAEIISAFSVFYEQLRSVNPKAQVLLTVSPVRHLKDTLPVNSISKATLLLATHELYNTFENVHYFPSYEIMNDDLRDYRFYKEDMVHPSGVAEQYLYEKFSESCFDPELTKFEKRWQKIEKSLAHRPFNAQSIKHQDFLKKILAELEDLSEKTDVQSEIDSVKAQLLLGSANATGEKHLNRCF
ncbi:MAG: GSCFA domain-containing protein, partial [Cyclobacteriaceae bacterium]